MPAAVPSLYIKSILAPKKHVVVSGKTISNLATISTALYNLKTIHLFTVDNIQPVIIPWTITGICCTLSGSAITNDSTPDLYKTLARAPYALLWMWLNILTFAVANQRLPDSISEDKINKAWRAIPAGRLSMNQAKTLLLFLVPLDMIIGIWLGAGYLTGLAVILSYLYNDLGGADLHWFTRNFINACAMAVACAGTTAVSIADDKYRGGSIFNNQGCQWVFLQAAIVMTTLQVQDLRDLDGDTARGRSTMPVDLGDNFTRWSIVLTVLPWSAFCPAFWSANILGTGIILALGSWLSCRVLMYRDVQSDRATWKMWGVWTLMIFMLPLYSNPAALQQLYL